MEKDKRLIEDYLPIDVINAIAAKEKKHPKHPVALVHYWPARRPTVACRAAIYAALVPAPKDDRERREAAEFVEKLSAFSPDPEVLALAANRILGYFGGTAPKVLDIFAGGGAIPLEAARLGCESHALEYNPVAHLVELCTLVYPQRFGQSLATDVKHWGDLVLARLRTDVGNLYPPVRVPRSRQVLQQAEIFEDSGSRSGDHRSPVAYIWVRTVPCKRPGCGAVVPLVRQAWLRKKGARICAVPHPSGGGQRITWKIVTAATEPNQEDGDAEQTGAGESSCLVCTAPVPSKYVKECAVAGKLGETLAAVVVDGERSKLYLPPSVTAAPDATECQARLDALLRASGIQPLNEAMNTADSTTVAGRGYGISVWSQLFTPRQLLVLFSLVRRVREAHREMIAQKMDAERARAVTTYLAMAFGRLANSFTKFCRWQNRDQITIAAIGDRQALKMVYDFSEINPFAETAGCLPFALENEVYCIKQLAAVKRQCVVVRGNAEELPYDDETFDAVITDPPYYSSIFYADLSAFFYVWLRRLIGDLYPLDFVLPTPPKRREAVAQPSEHDGDEKQAEEHYRGIMERAFLQARRVMKPGAPLVCVYAHKTTEGWASLIKAFVPAGLTVTEAWPVQTEARGRTNALEAAALSDSIFFVARRRELDGVGEYEADVRPEVERIARERIATLWAGGQGIGGADLLMAAVGAGLRAYTQFARVNYANGEEVSPERYLQEVEGVVLDTMLEQLFGFSKAGVSAVDALTRFYVLWRFTYRESKIEAGDVFVFCYPQGIEIDGPLGVSGPLPALVEKSRTTYRVRSFLERGDNDNLGIPQNGQTAPLIDVLHRTLWLLEKAPRELPAFLRDANPNLEQLRLVAEALSKPVLRRLDVPEADLTNELRALSKLTSNWRSVMEGTELAAELEERRKGQKRLAYRKGENQ